MDLSDGVALRGETRVAAGLAFAGAVGYLLEWAVIFVVSPPGPRGPGEPTSQLVDAQSACSGQSWSWPG